MGNYLQSWTVGPAYPDNHRKYLYTSLENIDKDQEDQDDLVELGVVDEDVLPDLPVEVWSSIIAQLSFHDKVTVTQLLSKLCRAVSIFRLISALSIRCSENLW